MKKLYKIIFVQKEGIANKWWHRLANVFIFGSTIVVIALVLFFFTEVSWKKQLYTYNFEENYKEIKSKEEYCSFDPDPFDNFNSFVNSYKNTEEVYDIVSVSCGEFFTAEDFLIKYTKSKGTLQDLQKTIALSKATYDSILKQDLKMGRLDDIKFKKYNIILWNKLVIYFIKSIFVVVLWFILWQSIIYRTILYVIYGKNK